MSSSKRELGPVTKDKEMKRKVYNQVVFEAKLLCYTCATEARAIKGNLKTSSIDSRFPV